MGSNHRNGPSFLKCACNMQGNIRIVSLAQLRQADLKDQKLELLQDRALRFQIFTSLHTPYLMECQIYVISTEISSSLFKLSSKFFLCRFFPLTARNFDSLCKRCLIKLSLHWRYSCNSFSSCRRFSRTLYSTPGNVITICTADF